LLYRTRLEMPLVAMTRDAVLSIVEAALAAEARVESFQVEPESSDELDPVEHVSVTLRIDASSDAAAHRTAEALHDESLRRVLASVPPDGTERGWTSGFQLPEPVTG
jgi:hypothetical protein